MLVMKDGEILTRSFEMVPQNGQMIMIHTSYSWIIHLIKNQMVQQISQMMLKQYCTNYGLINKDAWKAKFIGDKSSE